MDHKSTPANVIVAAIGLAIVSALVLPAIAQQRAQARASACAANLRQVGLGIHNYHSAFKQLPPGCGGTQGGKTPETSNQGRLGPLVAILPFVEHQALWEEIINPYTDKNSGTSFPGMGPVPWYDAKIYNPWSRAPGIYACPDRPEAERRDAEQKIVYTLEVDADLGIGLMTNYVACYGDGTLNVGQRMNPRDLQSVRSARATNRGIFVAGQVIRFRDVLDGLSNTAMFSETRASLKGKPGTSGVAKGIAGISMSPSLCLIAAKDEQTAWWDFGRGSRWCDGALPISGFQTVLPPNSPSCTSDKGLMDAIASASSDHVGGVHLLMSDGAIVFVTDQVDTGDLDAPGVAIVAGYGRPGAPSPYGIWGAMGSRASKETINVDGVAAINPVTSSRTWGGSKNEFTTWISREGDTRLTAMFVRIIDRKTIELEDRHGTLHRVPLNSLRDKDIFRAVQADLMSKDQP